MIAVVPAVKVLGGVGVVVADAAVVAQVATGQLQPVLGSWGQAGIFIAGCGAGAAAVAWTLRTLRDARQPAGNGNDAAAAERRAATAVHAVIEEISDTRHELRQQIQQLHSGIASLERTLVGEFRAIERRFADGRRNHADT